MKRPFFIGLLFVGCIGMGAIATVWLSATILRLDREQKDYERLAAIEERVRLALWRMESALGPFIGEESKRPSEYYQSFYRIDEAFDTANNDVDGEILTPSPLMTFESIYILLHFQIDPGGATTSPQVPPLAQRALADSNYLTMAPASSARSRLADVKERLSYDTVRGQLRQRVGGAPDAPHVYAKGKKGEEQQALSNISELNARLNQVVEQKKQTPTKVRVKETRNVGRGVRGSGFRNDALRSAPVVAPSRDTFFGVPGWDFESWREEAMVPMWINGELFLVREVTSNGTVLLQGCWLQWSEIHRWLLGLCADLLPEAQLLATNGHDDLDPTLPGRQLAALPVRLIPGRLPDDYAAPVSALHWYLGIAVGGIALATAAMATLLWGAVSLSERRGRFVSAVTHELRTPLTTFRMYTEMLSGGMVKDTIKRQQYLDTLHAESSRLSHLVENVLAYARLERGPQAGRMSALSAIDLLTAAEDSLAQRAEQADMLLLMEAEAPGATVSADADAVGQILFNLVDNACKYARNATDRRIHVSLACDGKHVYIHVLDHGPGIAPGEAQRIFRPFTKSVQQAAQSAPGVGLGLGLSRRLARDMGGKLFVSPDVREGACFVLQLPRVPGNLPVSGV